MKNNDSEFAWHVHGYLNSYIKFGDTKAALISGLSGPLVYGLFGLSSWKLSWTLPSFFGLLAMAAFATAFCFAFTAIWPNLLTIKVKQGKRRSHSIETDGKEAPDKGFIFWKNILAHPNANAFANECAELTDEQKLKHVSHHCYELAGITDRKYWLITVGARSFAFGIVALTIFVALNWGDMAVKQQGTSGRASESHDVRTGDNDVTKKLDSK